MYPVAHCPWITLAEINSQYGEFAVYVDAMRDECTKFIGRKPDHFYVDEDPSSKQLILSFEWTRR